MYNKRIAQIFTMLEKQQTITVDEICEKFNVSTATARRDLQEMEDSKMVSRFYGGAVLSKEQKTQKNFSVREMMNTEEKAKIARYCASLIRDNSIIYLDAGSTALKIIDYIYARNITVYTQGINTIQKLADYGIRCFVCAGAIKTKTRSILSKETIGELENIRFDLAFVGVDAIHKFAGLLTTDDLEAQIKQVVLKNAQQNYIIADGSKFDAVTDVKFADINHYPIITGELRENVDYSFYKNIISVTKNGTERYEFGKKVQ